MDIIRPFRSNLESRTSAGLNASINFLLLRIFNDLFLTDIYAFSWIKYHFIYELWWLVKTDILISFFWRVLCFSGGLWVKTNFFHFPSAFILSNFKTGSSVIWLLAWWYDAKYEEQIFSQFFPCWPSISLHYDNIKNLISNTVKVC